jgi:hypothetical protein
VTLTDEEVAKVREGLRAGWQSANADCDSHNERLIETALAILDAKRGEPDVNALMLDAILTGLTGKPSQEGEP